MPPLPALRTPFMVALEKLARSASRDWILRCIERGEELCPEIDPQRTYPDEWLFFRLTNERREMKGSALGEVATTLGSDVLRDLPSLVERLCVQAGWTEDELIQAGGLRAADLAERWHMSRKTLDRLRRVGLLARRGSSSHSKHVLVFMPGSVASFEKLHSARLASAGSYSRLTSQEQDQLLAEYRALREKRAISITAAAKELATRHGRSVEGVRLFLKREAKRAKAIALAGVTAAMLGRPDAGLAGEDHGPINATVRRVLLRASRSPLDLDHLAKRFDRTRPAVRRAVVLARAEALWKLRDVGHLIAPVGPTFTRADAAEVLLAPAIVRQGMGGRGETDLLDIINDARRSPPPTGAEERARLIAFQFIRFDVARRLDSIDRLHPKAPAVDEVETMLRWAARLKAEVLRPHLRLVLQTIEGRFGRRAEEIRATDLRNLVQLAIRHAGHAIELIEGTRGGRVAGPIGLAVDKALVEWLRHSPSVDANPRRASSLLTFGTTLPDWTQHVSPWQRWLEPDPRLRLAVDGAALSKDMASFLSARFGWGGGAPMTLDELAKERGLTHIRAAMFEYRCLKEAMDQARGQPKPPPAMPIQKRA